jgi:hypothetical protein
LEFPSRLTWLLKGPEFRFGGYTCGMWDVPLDPKHNSGPINYRRFWTRVGNGK